MNIDIRDCQMVAAIAASGSVTRAAGELNRTQSAVSHQLRGIEDRLGTPLFLRVGKRMVVTAAGERVLAAAHRVLEDIRATEEDVRRLGARETGVVRVCAQCNTGYHWLPPLVEVFRRRHPEIEVSLAVECTLRPLEALLEGRLDVAIVTQSVRHDQVRVRPLFEDEHAAIVAPDHPFAKRTFVRPEDFASERLLLYSSSPDDSFTFQTILRPAGVVPQRVTFVMLTEAILEMVKARPRDQRDADLGDRACTAGRGGSRHPDHRPRHPQAVECGHAEGRRNRRSRGRVHRAAGEPRDAGPPASALASWPGATKMMGRMRAAVTSR